MEQQTPQKKPGIIRRAATGTVKAWAYSIGLPALVKTGKRIGGNLSAAGAHVRHQLNDSPGNHRCETFDEAMMRQGLDEAHLIKRAKIFNTASLSWLAAMLMATALLGWLAMSDTLTVKAFLLSVALIFMTGAKSATWRFRFCQIRDQSLEQGFVQWLRSPGRW